MGAAVAAPLLLVGAMRKRKKRKRTRRKPAKRRARQPGDLVLPRPKRRPLTLKRAAKALAKMLYVHLVKVPEDDREERIAYVEKAVAKRLEKLTGKKKSPPRRQRTRGGKRRKV